MNRNQYHKIQTQFEKKMRLKEHLIDKVSSVKHCTRKDAKDIVEWILHLKGVSFLSYCRYKKKYPNNLVKALRTVIKKLSEVKK